jgi:hypothetical protein
MVSATSATAVGPRASSVEGCRNALNQGFANPQQAYAAYAEAINASRWCQAINTFAPEVRAEVALANFKTLALAAGADNPKRPAYQQRFEQFCRQHQLRCGTPESTAALAQGIMLRLPLDSELSDLRALSAEQPEEVYVQLMRSMTAADASAMSKFDVPLIELQIDGERATGKAPQTNGGVSTLPFTKTPSGWMLGLR